MLTQQALPSSPNAGTAKRGCLAKERLLGESNLRCAEENDAASVTGFSGLNPSTRAGKVEVISPS